MGQAAISRLCRSTMRWCGNQPVSSFTQRLFSRLSSQSHFMNGEPSPSRLSQSGCGTAEISRMILMAMLSGIGGQFTMSGSSNIPERREFFAAEGQDVARCYLAGSTAGPTRLLTTRAIDLIDSPMVVYDLICKKQHRFEAWFPNYEEYQKQADKKLISCPTCGSTGIEKLPHACAVHVKKELPAPVPKKTEKAPPGPPSPAEFKEMLLRVHHYIKENFEDVGSRFAEEARQIHCGKTEERPIHGTATPEERAELTEEGIPYAILPKPELDS